MPATPGAVRDFVDKHRSKYEGDLARLRLMLEDLRKSEPGLRSIYKIYSRGDGPGADELKSARKIRLKFNDYNVSKGSAEASLFDTPDIVGLTVVVTYPSGISAVAEVLDREIDVKALRAVDMGPGDPNTGIITRHGRALGSKGYFACHYNVRLPGAGRARPICEIQIKALLHDAWGAKTHDLTYKPAGRIGEELLQSFDLLGANLANLDKQSDSLRTAIMRAASAREGKRRKVQIAILRASAGRVVSEVSDVGIQKDMLAVLDAISSMNIDTPTETSDPVSLQLLAMFDDGAGPPGTDVAASTLLCLLAAMTRRTRYMEMALEALEVREGATADPVSRLMVKLDSMLAPFAGGDVAEAIDAAEEIQQEIEAILGSASAPSDPFQFARIRTNVLSDLAYFHADLIGSHEGEKRRSIELAAQYMKEAVSLYADVGFPSAGLYSEDADIIAVLAGPDGDAANQAFFSLDNEAYVGIQCATDEAGLRNVRARLEFLHSHVPSSAAELARLAIDYHDYCARERLAELERVFVP